MVRKGSRVRVPSRASARPASPPPRADARLPARGLLSDRRAAGLRRRDPRFLRARVRDPGAAREADRGLHELHHNDALYKQMAELGWLGVTIPEEYGGSGGSMLDACLFMEEIRAGSGPDRRLRDDADRRRRHPALRHRRAEAGDPRRDRRWRGRGDRDDRARGRLRRRRSHHLGRAGQRRLRPQRAEGLHLQRPHRRPHPRRLPYDQGRVQARGPLDDLAPPRDEGARDRPDQDDGRRRDQPPLPDRCRGSRPTPSSARSTRPGPS